MNDFVRLHTEIKEEKQRSIIKFTFGGLGDNVFFSDSKLKTGPNRCIVIFHATLNQKLNRTPNSHENHIADLFNFDALKSNPNHFSFLLSFEVVTALRVVEMKKKTREVIVTSQQSTGENVPKII